MRKCVLCLGKYKKVYNYWSSMGRYYDVSAILSQGVRLGKVGTYQPHLSDDKTLIGIAVLTDGKGIWAIAPDLSGRETFRSYCIDKTVGYNLLTVELYHLDRKTADKIPDAPAIIIEDLVDLLTSSARSN